MKDVFIAAGKYKKIQEGKGVYAARNFDIGEVVLTYTLAELSEEGFSKLPEVERQYVHSFWGKMYLFSAPARYVNHSATPNTRSDIEKQVQIAIEPIRKGDMITINATEEVQFELETCISAYEGNTTVKDFDWLQGGYRTAVVQYSLPGSKKKKVSMRRLDGNWRILSEEYL